MPGSHLILLAEDDVQYAFVIQLALQQAGIDNPVHLVTSRNQVIDYLRGAGPYADRSAYPLPIALLLALRLPLLEDLKALRWVRHHREFHHLRIAVLSDVEYGHERQLALELGADSYHVKPSDFEGLLRIAKRLCQRWFAPAGHQAAA